jgi:hypothetical protein
MPDEPHDENLDDALFGEGSAPPPPSRPSPGPGDDLEWFADADDALPALPPLSAEEDDDELFFGPRDLEPIGAPAPQRASDPDAEGPIVDAAMFGTSAGAVEGSAAGLTRRELHARPLRHDRGKRLVVALLVAGVVLLVGAGVLAFASGDDSGNQTQVKVVGTDLPSTTVTTRPATSAPTTVAPTTVAPTAAPTTRSGGVVTPARTTPPPAETDPAVQDTQPNPCASSVSATQETTPESSTTTSTSTSTTTTTSAPTTTAPGCASATSTRRRQ